MKKIFTPRDMISVEKGSITYYMACELKDMGAPIEFNVLNVDLKPEDIKITGNFKDRLLQDGSHEFTWSKE